jgi:CBS domain-containing protein
VNTVALILKAKQHQSVLTIAPTATVMDAVRMMAEYNIGGLPVVEGDRIVGIVTERDYARKVALQGRSSEQTLVRDIMTSQVMYVSPAQTTEECMALMTDKRLRHLPVLDEGRLVGLISIGDLVKDIISEQQFVIDQLRNYIAS